MEKIRAFAAREPFFIIVLFLTIAVSFVTPPDIKDVNWNVLAALFCLMAATEALKASGFLESAGCRILSVFRTERSVSAAMIAVTGILAMFVTNDVALITMVPLTIAMGRMTGADPARIIIFETLSANLFSALTPFGNPQNLYIYYFYDLSAGSFLKITLPFFLVGAVTIYIANHLLCRPKPLACAMDDRRAPDSRLLAAGLASFAVAAAAVLGLFGIAAALVFVLVVFLLVSPRTLLKIDYPLLATFFLFFIFAGCISSNQTIRGMLSSAMVDSRGVLVVSALASQIISNVPSAVLVSGFTSLYAPLLIGVSAGGLGTPVASLASLISYKMYKHEFGRTKEYLTFFSAINFALLAVLLAIFAALY